ncbi:hypothetical protein NQ315_013078 [Exocentrus adspersus]|uniref:Uncharacterized protein n=1 Tax=Exocentrus adspersus TaxID=1586481 RepID=A0AAV8VWD6_9CUCU|nr:hypothetical protein NQ315_013078 [Exocentrus adspersus]
MQYQNVALFATLGLLLYFSGVLSYTVPLECSQPNICAQAHVFCPGIVIICNGPNQEIRHTGWCNCCNGCFNISHVEEPCGPDHPEFKCARKLTCDGHVCKEP